MLKVPWSEYQVHVQYAIAPLIVAGIIAAAGSILGGILKGKSDKNANEDQREYNDMAYGRQRSDALADWNMQNEYNSPTSQMARMRQAGLNPILAAGNITSSSPTVRSTDYNSYNPRPVDYSSTVSNLGQIAGDTIMSSADLRSKEAQTDNLKAQNTVILEDAILKRAQTLNLLSQSDKTAIDTSAALFSLRQNMRLADTQFDAAATRVAMDKQAIDINSQKNVREEASNTQSIIESAARIGRMRVENAKSATDKREGEQRIRNMESDQQLKAWELKMRKENINPGDAMWNRSLQKLLNDLGITKDGSIVDGARKFSRKVDSTASDWWNHLKNATPGYRQFRIK